MKAMPAEWDDPPACIPIREIDLSSCPLFFSYSCQSVSYLWVLVLYGLSAS